MARKPCLAILFGLGFILSVGVPQLRASSGYDELQLCKAGSTVDKVCLQKHQGNLEKYVIHGVGPYVLKLAVADTLADYYFNVGQQPSEASRLVLSKRLAYKQAKTIDLTVFKSHYQDCQKGPDCSEGYFLDLSGSELEQEKEMKIKEYFLSLDQQLFAPEIKYLDRDIKYHARQR